VQSIQYSKYSNINYALIQNSWSVKLQNYSTKMLNMAFSSTLIFYDIVIKNAETFMRKFFLTYLQTECEFKLNIQMLFWNSEIIEYLLLWAGIKFFFFFFFWIPRFKFSHFISRSFNWFYLCPHYLCVIYRSIKFKTIFYDMRINFHHSFLKIMTIIVNKIR
jgi:hypothetical protein